MNKITLLLIDDHQLIMEAWSFLLNKDERFEVVGTTGDANFAYDAVRDLHPQVVLCDIGMTPVDGLVITSRIRKISPRTQVIGVSIYSEPAYAKKMLEAGATGYVTKNSGIEEMKRAIVEVSAGKKYICDDIKDKLVSMELINDVPVSQPARLTSKEIDIMHAVQKGMSSKEIAEALGIKLKTVEVHRYNIKKKLNLKNTAALVNYINMQGL